MLINNNPHSYNKALIEWYNLKKDLDACEQTEEAELAASSWTIIEIGQGHELHKKIIDQETD